MKRFGDPLKHRERLVVMVGILKLRDDRPLPRA
jgi:hypothetical protein